MGYIGKLPATQGKDAGPALKIDDISSDFDGLTSVFSLAVNGTLITPHVNNISVYLSGVYQIPGNSYSLSGSYIVFTGAPSSSLDFHGAILGASRLFIPDNATVETSAFTTDTITSISGSRDAASISGSFGNQRVGTTDDVQFNHISSSGNITASGDISASSIKCNFIEAVMPTGAGSWGGYGKMTAASSSILSHSSSMSTLGHMSGKSLNLSTDVASAASVDLPYAIINGRRGEIRSQLQAGVAVDTGWNIEVRNTSIAANSLIIANVIGGEGAIVTGSVLTANTVSAGTGSFNFFNIGAAIVDNADFTASFAVL